MADLVITPANVQLSTEELRVYTVLLGATMTPGQPYYIDTADSKAKPADASASATASAEGILITGGADGEYAAAVKSGKIEIGATVVQGAEYVVSANAGGLAPQADLSTGDYITSVGRASSASVLDVSFDATGIQAP